MSLSEPPDPIMLDWASIQDDSACCQLFCHISAACIQNWSGAAGIFARSMPGKSFMLGIPGILLKSGNWKGEPPDIEKPAPGDFTCCSQASMT